MIQLAALGVALGFRDTAGVIVNRGATRLSTGMGQEDEGTPRTTVLPDCCPIT
jgi:hypothetical protein